MLSYSKDKIYEVSTTDIFLGNLQIFKNSSSSCPKLKKTCNFIKKRLQHRCFPVNIAKLFRTPILKNLCERLLPATASYSKEH